MKKYLFAIVTMLVMSTSVMAQSNNEDALKFERMSNYLELTSDQMVPVKTAMAQFTNSMQAYNLLNDTSKGGEAWEKIQDRHKKTMKKILSEKQYGKYIKAFDLTAKNTAERIIEQQTANK